MSELGWLTQPAVFPWVALVLGLCVGSFLNVVIYRLPRMMERDWRADATSILEPEPIVEERGAWRARRRLALTKKPFRRPRKVTENNPADSGTYNLFIPRSACPKCDHRIAWWENVPIISYIVLQGKCAGCGAPISVRYPIVELLAGVGAAYSAAQFGWSLAALGGMLFIWCSIALAFIDQATGYLPDDITLPLLWAGLLFNLAGAFVPLQEAVIGAAAGYLSFWLVYWGFKLATGKEGMGYGDFKMNAAVGAFLGWKVLPLVILVSAVLGLIFGVAQMLAARGGWVGNYRFHFGPYIALAAIVTLFWGQAIFSLIPAISPF